MAQWRSIGELPDCESKQPYFYMNMSQVLATLVNQLQEEIMEDIDVFYMDPAFIDPDVYDLWLRGFCGNLERS